MAEFPALPLFTDAFIADTTHLDALATGAYMSLLMAAWRSPLCALPADDEKLARMARCDSRQWAKVRGDVLAFWKPGEDGFLRQKRLMKERDFCNKSRAAKVAAAEATNKAKLLKSNNTGHAERAAKRVAECHATVTQPTPTPTPTPKEEIRVEESPHPYSPDNAEELRAAVAAWNDVAGDLRLAKVQALADHRKTKLRKRLAECGGLGGWNYALSKIRGSPFLRGEKTDWKADFDWLLQAKSFTKLMEGGYDGPIQRSNGSPSSYAAVSGRLDAVLDEMERREQAAVQGGGRYDPSSIP